MRQALEAIGFGRSRLNQLKEAALDRKYNTYGPSLEALAMDDSTVIVCRENITNTFTLDKVRNVMHAHTFLFSGDHGERTTGEAEQTFCAQRGKATIMIDGVAHTLRRGQRITLKAHTRWNLIAVGGIFEYTTDLPATFDLTRVTGDMVPRESLPDIEGTPYKGDFMYHHQTC